MIHHCLLWVQKIRIQKFLAILKKSRVNFVLEVIGLLFLWTKGFQTHLCICVNANVCMLVDYLSHIFFHVTSRVTMCFALFTWFAQAALLQQLESSRLQQAKHTTGAKHRSIGTGLCLNARTQMYLSKQPFSWLCSKKITIGRLALTEKPGTAFPEFVYIIVILSYVFASNEQYWPTKNTGKFWGIDHALTWFDTKPIVTDSV